MDGCEERPSSSASILYQKSLEKLDGAVDSINFDVSHFFNNKQVSLNNEISTSMNGNVCTTSKQQKINHKNQTNGKLFKE